MLKKYIALLFFLFLAGFLFYVGVNLAEEGIKNILGIDCPPRAFSITLIEEKELEIYWSGNSKRINTSIWVERINSFKDNLQTILFRKLWDNDTGEEPNKKSSYKRYFLLDKITEE